MITPSDLEIETPLAEPLIRFRRFVAAPPELLFGAWTEPAQLKRWWGPADWELIVCEVDLRVGGRYRFVHRLPGGQEMGTAGEYLEIQRNRLLRNTFVFDGTPDKSSDDTTEFIAVPGGTLVAGTSVHESVAARDEHIAGGMERGMRDTYQRLDEWVAGPTKGKP